MPALVEVKRQNEQQNKDLEILIFAQHLPNVYTNIYTFPIPQMLKIRSNLSKLDVFIAIPIQR